MEPILKWAGGKRQCLNALRRFIPREEIIKGGYHYYEPFIGGGSVCFALDFPFVHINDLNTEIVNVYEVIRDNPEELIQVLKEHNLNHSSEYYYQIRALDRDPDYGKLSCVLKAARVIYLNRTCYNGLYRVNSKGFFNVPVGRYLHPNIVMEDRIRALHNYFTSNEIVITNQDFKTAVDAARSGDFVYFDPPYDYDDSGFTSYYQGGFSHDDTTRLKETCDELLDRGCTVLVSNNETKFISELFGDPRYRVFHLNANRSINSKGEKRKTAKEIIIFGRP